MYLKSFNSWDYFDSPHILSFVGGLQNNKIADYYEWLVGVGLQT